MEQLRAFLTDPHMRELLQGGIWAWEVTYNQRRRQWHPHFHIIYDGRHLPEKGENTISGAWFEITGDSFVVDVRDVVPKELLDRWRRHPSERRPPTDDEKKRGLKECVKYITKAVEFSDDDDLVKEFLDATHGMRRFGKFGHAYDYKPPERDPKDKRWWRVELDGASYNLLECHGCHGRHFADQFNTDGLWLERREVDEVLARDGPKWAPPPPAPRKPSWRQSEMDLADSGPEPF